MADTAVVVQVGLTDRRGDATQGFSAPVTDDEVVEDALAAWDAGAAVIHLRGRGADGEPSGRAEHFAPLVEGIRAAGCDAILNFACGPPDAGGLDFLELRPELASLGYRTDRTAGLASDGPVGQLRGALAAFRDAGTAAEVQCRHFGDLRTLLELREEGLLEDPLRVQLLVEEATPEPIERVMQLSSVLPADAVWSVAGIGAGQLRLNVLCLIAGGHVRTGLEDNPWLVEDVPATNEQLVERIVRVIDQLDRPLATPDEARQILRIPEHTDDLKGRRSRPSPGPVDLHAAAG